MLKLIELVIIMKSILSMTFFSREKRNNTIKKSDYNRRQLIIGLFESNEPISTKQLSYKTGVAYSVAYENVESFIKSGIVTAVTIAQHKARRDSKYELTNNGKIIAFAVCADERRVIGDKKNDLQKIFQPQRGSDSMTFFVNMILLNSITNGLQRYVIEFLRNLVESAETSNEPNLWKIAQNGVSEAKPSELQMLQKSVLQALEGLDESQKDVVIQYYKTKTTDLLFDTSMKSHNSAMQELARKSSKDPEGIFTKFGCRDRNCGYTQDELYLKMKDVIVRVFSGGLQCPKCNRFTPESKVSNKIGFREKISTASK